MTQNSQTIIKIKNGLRLLEEYGLKLISTSWVKKIKSQKNLFELRIKSDKTIRIFFTQKEPKYFIMLHLFVKKSNKTPVREIETAIKRVKDIT